MRELFPNNAVVYFVSYYDYYQPEAYVPQTDTYIEKDASNSRALRSSATRRPRACSRGATSSWWPRSPASTASAARRTTRGSRPNVSKEEPLERDELIHSLIDIQYDRNDYDLSRGTFRVRGDTVDVFPPYAENPLRISFFGDEVELIAEVDKVTGELVREFDAIPIWPASHYVTERPKVTHALETINEELEQRVAELKANDRLLEAQRLAQRTSYDLEMLETMGYCNGIENYSRHLDGRKAGEPPYTLIDYFPKDMVCIIDESHVTVPQIRGMYEGDRSRKGDARGPRLPPALRPRQPPVALRRVRGARAPVHLRLGHARRLRGVGHPAAGRADHPPHRASRPQGRRPPGERADRRPHLRDQGARGQEGARARDHAHQAHGRGPHRPPARRGRARELHALGHRHARPR